MTRRPLSPSIPDLILVGLVFLVLLLPWTFGALVMRWWDE